jgi:hypothetical protein
MDRKSLIYLEKFSTAPCGKGLAGAIYSVEPQGTLIYRKEYPP